MSSRSRSRSIMSTISSRPRSQSSTRQRSTDRNLRLPKNTRASRSCSPGGGPNPRVAKLNMYLAKSAANSTQQVHSIQDVAPSSTRATQVKRWDGNRRTTIKWDSIRRDPELWFPDGDCLVHFYERGFSRRGASLRVSLADIEASNCGPLLKRYYNVSSPGSVPTSQESARLSDASEYFHDASPPAKHELFIPAPTHLCREEALKFHLTTRNFFAWVFEMPLVGDRLGQALISLQDRMHEYRPRPEQNQDEFLAYIDDQGYTDFRDCPDHALAVLQLAENFQYRELWTDAFVHCTGMNDQLSASAEFEVRFLRTSNFNSQADILHSTRLALSQALIWRAHIEMDLCLEKAGRGLANFLEDDLSGAKIGLGKEAHLHLERFRSFLHTYYVGQHCYWPPPPPASNSEAFSKSAFRSMYFDFRNLYEYLVDQRSGTQMQNNRPVDGGICVFQNIVAFDTRNKYTALPHPLPLVPKIPTRLSARKSFGRLSIFGGKQARLDRRVAASGALASATNTIDEHVMNSGLVREYLRFEKVWTMKEEGTVTCADARKVRWILVYAILQTLISVTRVPSEVRDTEGVSYPLCCQTAGTPPWTTSKGVIGSRKRPQLQAIRTMSLKDQILELGPDMDVISAKPSPLILPTKRSKTPSPPRRISVSQEVPLRSPKPLRSTSWEILSQEHNGVSPIITHEAHTDKSLPTTASVSPLSQPDTPVGSAHETSLPTIQPGALLQSSFDLSVATHDPEPSTPSTSENDRSSSGWSPNTSDNDDDMDHASVNGSDPSNYGDDEDDEPARQPKIPPRSLLRAASTDPATHVKRTASMKSFRPAEANPEIETYLQS